MSDEEKPRLVVTNTDADLEQRQVLQEHQQRKRDELWAEQEVESALRQMAANLMRVVRGAGKPYEIAENAQTFIQALVKYRDATGHLAVMDQFSTMLSRGARDYMKLDFKGANLAQVRAEEKAIRGALQVAASRLLGQSTQRSAGIDELSDGARELMAAYAEQSCEWDRAAREAAKASRQNTRKAAKNPKAKKSPP